MATYPKVKQLNIFIVLIYYNNKIVLQLALHPLHKFRIVCKLMIFPYKKYDFAHHPEALESYHVPQSCFLLISDLCAADPLSFHGQFIAPIFRHKEYF